MTDDKAVNIEVLSAAEGEYLWSYAFFVFESQIQIIKWTIEEFSTHATEKVKQLDQKLWAEDGKGFQDLLKDFKELNKERKLSTYKNPILRFKSDNDWIRSMNESINLMQGSNLIREMSLVYLVAVFENYLQTILSFSFRQCPGALRDCQKSISYSELLNHDSIESIKDVILQKEITVVNEDIEEVREYIIRKFGIDIAKSCQDFSLKIAEFTKTGLRLQKCSPFNWTNFKERIYRRNIIVHNMGVPNALYKRKTGYSGKDEKLEVSMDYLIDSLSLFYQLAMATGLSFEEKMNPKKEKS